MEFYPNIIKYSTLVIQTIWLNQTGFNNILKQKIHLG